MKYAVIVARLLFGLPLTVSGIMGFVKVMPDPHGFWARQEGFAPEAAELTLAIWDSGFMMHCVVAAHLLAGVLVLINRYVPLALLIHLPVSVMMLLFHAVLDPATGGIAYLVFLVNLFLMVIYQDAYRPLLVAKSPK